MPSVSTFPRTRLPLLAAIVCSLAFALIATLGAPVSAAATKSKTTASEETLTGTISSVTPSGFTLKTPGRATGVIAALTDAANRLAGQDWPYVWGGGHAQAGVASVGIKGGNGYNGKTKGFDCSGSVAAVLVAGGLWPIGASVPADQYVISTMQSAGEIAAGAGSGPDSVTLYDDPGEHIFMNIGGRFFGTSDGGPAGNSNGGPGWLPGYPYDATTTAYKRYHVLGSLLRASTTAGETAGFTYGSAGSAMLDGFPVGSYVKVTYNDTNEGLMVATAITYGRTYTMSGVVDTVETAPVSAGAPPSGQMLSFTITNSNGKSFTFTVNGQSLPLLRTGDGVTVTYARPLAVGTAKSAWTALGVDVTDSVSPDSGGVGA